MPEYVDVGDHLRDSHYIRTEVYDVTTASGRTSTCSATELTCHGCNVDTEGHSLHELGVHSSGGRDYG